MDTNFAGSELYEVLRLTIQVNIEEDHLTREFAFMSTGAIFTRVTRTEDGESGGWQQEGHIWSSLKHLRTLARGAARKGWTVVWASPELESEQEREYVKSVAWQ